ncbi:hypothetical protein NQ318_020167 [Aromia moschata]|uniref:Uncharacterized protein n=1 Tax=Aromia moschata TaxID=1265417 RepID=A0AAV8ZAA6_9CUCU|nr:hypothetical protein NQ318_020167 [Aromia moschata]
MNEEPGETPQKATTSFHNIVYASEKIHTLFCWIGVTDKEHYAKAVDTPLLKQIDALIKCWWDCWRAITATFRRRRGINKRRDVKDDPRPGRPSTSKTDENIEKTGKVIREEHRLSIRGLAEITGIDKECVRQILHESFNMRKVCAKMMPKLLTPEQKESRLTICIDILNNIDTDPGLLDTVTLKGTRFEYVEADKAKATEVLNQLTEADFQHCFQQWKSRMERCRDREKGEYIEDEKVATVIGNE